ncbi:MAG: hypothetical protein IPK58_01595 [Acidobacteria bacterium]|nr:hypothetical protein [Acidobacteriota bacterium]
MREIRTSGSMSGDWKRSLSNRASLRLYYDNIDRLISMTNGTSNENYSFDGIGNRTASHLSATYNYQPFNRVTSTVTANYGYDANGNMTTRMEGKEFWRYNWDYENRLVSASTRKQTVRYKYDALGRRIQRIVGNGRENTKFVYDGLDVVMDDNSGVPTKYQNGPGIDNKLKMSANGVSKYLIADHLGSTNALTDSVGAILEQTVVRFIRQRDESAFNALCLYRPRIRRIHGASLLSSPVVRRQSGTIHLRRPIGFEGNDINLFVYVHNNPLNYFDPEGTQVRADSRWEPWPREENSDMVVKIRNMPDPIVTDRWERLVACHERNKFSTLGSVVPYGQGTLEILETGSILSIGSDAVATGIKAGGTTFGMPQPYASGINMVLRRTNRASGYPKIGGFYPYKYLRPVGDKATRGFLVFGVLTFSYNTTVDIQCICGILE